MLRFTAVAAALLVALPALGAPDNTPPSEARLKQILEDIVKNAELGDADIGVHVRSLPDGKTLFSKGSTRLFNPASNVKLVTTAAALWYLGAAYKFKTIAYRDPKMHGTTVDGSLYVKGFGDPTLTDEQVFGFVNEIALHGITEIAGDLVLDESFFDSVYEGPGWEQEHGDRSYAPSMGALAVNFGTFTIRVLPGNGIGSDAQVLVWPDIPSIEVNSSAQTAGDDARSHVMIGTSKGEGTKALVTVRGAVGIDDPEGVTVYRRAYHPTIYAGEHIRKMLEMRGVKIKGKTRVGTVAKNAVTVAVHESLPLADVVSVLNKFSNNFIAEQILKTMGAELGGQPGTWQKGCDVVAQFLGDIGIQKGSYVLGNGSGLNDVNRFTPEQLTQILESMYKRYDVQAEYVSSLAVAGASGTITSRFANAPAQMKLRAKTGTLTGVSALSGYVSTRDQRVLAFSIMMNGYSGRTRGMWKVQEAIGNALADFKSGEVVAQP
ncbi:MAG: D-alanyl-D-alanine carboxypeptidase/D-alanyl-D-alanine-endopeptidase [Myxococcota bacterium]